MISSQQKYYINTSIAIYYSTNKLKIAIEGKGEKIEY